MKYFWLFWFELLIHTLTLGGLLPFLFSAKSDELNLLGYLVLGLLVTKDYYVIKYLIKKVKK